MSGPEPIRLNIGCGGRPLLEYLNVDMDDLASLRRRYPHQTFSDEIRLVDFDIFNMPYEPNSVDEVRADGLLEHLPFIDEPRFLNEVKRVLKPGGLFRFSVPDFEQVCRNWLAAKDDWQDFYRMDDAAIAKQHWFGTYTYKTDNRWGYITATIYGSQHGEGQYHRNCYSDGKIRAMCAKLGFDVKKLEKFLWKGDRDPMLDAEVIKRA
jgi:SAM-dependent methyltransferase